MMPETNNQEANLYLQNKTGKLNKKLNIPRQGNKNII